MAYAFRAEEFNGFANFFRAANLSGVHQAAQADGGSPFVDSAKRGGGHAELISANAERNDVLRTVAFRRVNHKHGFLRPELPDGIEHEAQMQAARGERLGGGENGVEIRFGPLPAQEHDADG